MKKVIIIYYIVFFMLFITVPAFSKEPNDTVSLKSELDEELSWIQEEMFVFTASRHEQKISETAAAVYVVSHEDIRRSGATNIPDILRLVPGLQVAQINSNMWAITSRGSTARFANKLLVLMDGRTIYNSTFTGVLWETKDTLIEDIERIEVIRGPGAALWGANAVNGIINIITKKAEDTQGAFLTTGIGSEENFFGGVRYGGKVGDNLFYRGYGKYFDRDSTTLYTTSENASDHWDAVRGGFKIDWEATTKDSFTLQGDIYEGDSGNVENFVAPPPFPVIANTKNEREFSGGNVLGRYSHTFSDTSDMTLQLYFDRTIDKWNYVEVGAGNMSAGAQINTYDLDFQHRFSFGDRNEITWGVGTRHIYDKIRNSANISYSRKRRHAPLYSAFLQDEITLIKDKLKLTLGLKYENNDYTGNETMPNARLLWTPNDHNTVWASVSRAVRTPTRAEHDINEFFAGRAAVLPPTFLVVKGNNEVQSEELTAYEIGYRTSPIEDVSIDIAAFHYDYDKLRTGERGPIDLSNFPTYISIPVNIDNELKGDTYGVEVSAQWQAQDWWLLHANYSFLDIQLHSRGEMGLLPEFEEGQSPENQASLRSLMDLPMDLELDTTVRYVDHLPALDINSYHEMDLRLGWKPKDGLELSIAGRNLLDNGHEEFKDSRTFITPSSDIERSVYLKVTWSF